MNDKVLPISGGWVIITRRLPTEIQLPLFSMWFAMPDRLFPEGWHTERFPSGEMYAEETLSQYWRYRVGRPNLLPHELEKMKKLEASGLCIEQRIRVITPDGEVWVEPYEWKPANDIRAFIALIGDGIILHQLGGLDKIKAMREQVFYLRSRGLSKLEAHLLVMGNVNKPNIFWLEVEKQYADFFSPRPSRRTPGLPRMKVKIEIEERAP